MPPAILYYAIPGFIILVCAEWYYSYKENKALYEANDDCFTWLSSAGSNV